MSWIQWAGYFSDVVRVSCLTAMMLYLWKILMPAVFHDRFASIALGLAFVGSGFALWGGLLWGETPAWALFAWPLLGMFWLLESEFGTRILGLIAGLEVFGGMLVLPWRTPVPVGHDVWMALTVSGALLAGAFQIFALGTWIIVILYRHSSSLSARKTARFFVVNMPVVAELAYRLNGWALPFATFAAGTSLLGLAARQVAPMASGMLVLAGVASAGHAVATRRQGTEGTFNPWWLLMAGLLVVAGFWALGLFRAP